MRRHRAALLALTALAPMLGLLGVAPPVARPAEADPPGAFAVLGSARFRHRGGASCVAYSPDGRLLASGGNGDGTVKVQRASDGQVLWRARHDSSLSNVVRSVTFSPDGKRLVSAGLATGGATPRSASAGAKAMRERMAARFGRILGTPSRVIR